MNVVKPAVPSVLVEPGTIHTGVSREPDQCTSKPRPLTAYIHTEYIHMHMHRKPLWSDDGQMTWRLGSLCVYVSLYHQDQQQQSGSLHIKYI